MEVYGVTSSIPEVWWLVGVVCYSMVLDDTGGPAGVPISTCYTG